MRTSTNALWGGTQCSLQHGSGVSDLILQFLGEKTGWKRLLNLTPRGAEPSLESSSGSMLCALFYLSASAETDLPPGDSRSDDFTSAAFP